MKSLFRWAGSKRKLLPSLLDSLPPDFKRYVEPFAGSACLFFSLKPKKAVIADINGELINAYRLVKRDPRAVADRLSLFRGSRTEYYKVRAIDPGSLSECERAAHFIYLNRFCFNGLYRTNRQGRFNVPFGGHKSGELPSYDALAECSRLLRRVRLLASSFENTLDGVVPGDFVYLDPPYCIASRRVFNEYSNYSFGEKELKRLRQYLKQLDKIGAYFLVSYGLSREARELGQGYNIRHLTVQRHIAGFASHRRRYREMLITNYR